MVGLALVQHEAFGFQAAQITLERAPADARAQLLEGPNIEARALQQPFEGRGLAGVQLMMLDQHIAANYMTSGPRRRFHLSRGARNSLHWHALESRSIYEHANRRSSACHADRGPQCAPDRARHLHSDKMRPEESKSRTLARTTRDRKKSMGRADGVRARSGADQQRVRPSSRIGHRGPDNSYEAAHAFMSHLRQSF